MFFCVCVKQKLLISKGFHKKALYTLLLLLLLYLIPDNIGPHQTTIKEKITHIKHWNTHKIYKYSNTEIHIKYTNTHTLNIQIHIKYTNTSNTEIHKIYKYMQNIQMHTLNTEIQNIQIHTLTMKCTQIYKYAHQTLKYKWNIQIDKTLKCTKYTNTHIKYWNTKFTNTHNT